MEMVSQSIIMGMFYYIILLLLFSFVRALLGPSIWDRLLGMNIIATKIVSIIIIYATLKGTAFFIDFALIYALTGFIGTIYTALFFADRNKRSVRK